jgi:hypothetical protein
MYTIAARSRCWRWIFSTTTPHVDGRRLASFIARLLDQRSVSNASSDDLSEHQQHCALPFRRQRRPQGCTRPTGLAHGVTPATEPAPEALHCRFSVICRMPSNYQRQHVWDIERAFRSLKTVDLEVRPIHHRRAQRVRAHVLLCMLAYYLEWHMRRLLKPILFDDHNKGAAEAARASIVAKAERSAAADRKAATKRTDDDLPVHSFRSLLADLATVTHNTMAMPQSPDAAFVLYPKLTPAQDRAFQLLGVPVKL